MIVQKPRKPRFLKIKCDGCGNEQVIYSHSSSTIKCPVCSRTLATPKGGKAEIKTTITGTAR